MRKIFIFTAVLFFAGNLGNPAYAYIDPGTGSMLFSIILGLVTTLIFVLNSLILKLKIKLFSGGRGKLNNEKIVIYSEGAQYYCVFKPILDEFEKRKIPVTFFTSDKNDPFFIDDYDYVKGSFIGKGNIAYFKLAMLRADVCLMTTPHLDVMQLKRSKFVKHYCHILHSISFSLDYRLFALDYYDSVICDADFQIPMIRELEKKRNLPQKELFVAGSTYMDYYYSGIKNLPEKKDKSFTVLIAPSWGRDGLLRKHGEKIINKLIESDYKIIIRPHPQSMLVEKKIIDKFKDKYGKYKNVEWNFDKDNLKILSQSDVMISDFSCVMFDYAFLFNRPFLFFKTITNNEMYDMCDLDETPYRYRIMDEIGREIKENDIDNICEIIEQFRNSVDIGGKIEKIKNTCWMYEGQAAVRAVDFLVEKKKEVSRK